MMNDIREVRGYYPPNDEWPDVSAKMIKEGGIEFKMVDAENIYDAPAFFNPVMVLNRDLAILFAEVYSQKNEVEIRVFEPLAGIGIRALRMAKESSEFISEIVINDFGEISSKIAAYNIKKLALGEKIYQFRREARSLSLDLSEQRFRYHYIDLDPFGPPTPFIDSMWPVMHRRSMIAVTATDMQALCGVYPKACNRKYGGFPLNNHHTHETAARLMIASVVRSAARFDRGLKPIFTSAVDHYTKVFFLSFQQKGAANNAVEIIGYSYTCDNCSQIKYIAGDRRYVDCCGNIEIAGPLWTGDLFDKEWCELAMKQLQTKDLSSKRRIEKLLLEGIDASGLPGYFSMDVIGRRLHVTQPSFKRISEQIISRGYRCVKTRFTNNSFRSDIPGVELMELIKNLVQELKEI